MTEQIVPIVQAEEVERHMQQGAVIIDARGGADARERYEAGHLRGAVFLDLESELSLKRGDPSQGGRHPLPEPGSFARLLGDAGISPATHVLVYDDKAGANAAARFWWMLRAAGHARIQVIDGGLTTLREKGLPIEAGPPVNMRHGRPYPFDDWKLPTADLDMVDKARSLPDYLVVDVRENYRYIGESEPIDLVAGHIPGAVNAPYLDNLGPDGRFKKADILAAKYQALANGRDPGKMIFHCGSGVTACHSLLAMEIAGMRGASLYVGSWSEWSRRAQPLTKGDRP